MGDIWPRRVGFEALLQAARERAGLRADAEDDAALDEVLAQSFTSGLIELHVSAPTIASEVSPRPTASPLARLQAQAGQARVTNLVHRMVALEDPIARYALQLLDGTRDHQAIQADLLAWVATQPDLQIDDAALVRMLGPNLGRLVRLALLVA
jgi:hypothetical protein